MTNPWLQAQATNEAARRWLSLMSCPRYREALERHINEDIAAYCAGDVLDDEGQSGDSTA